MSRALHLPPRGVALASVAASVLACARPNPSPPEPLPRGCPDLRDPAAVIAFEGGFDQDEGAHLAATFAAVAELRDWAQRWNEDTASACLAGRRLIHPDADLVGDPDATLAVRACLAWRGELGRLAYEHRTARKDVRVSFGPCSTPRADVEDRVATCTRAVGVVPLEIRCDDAARGPGASDAARRDPEWSALVSPVCHGAMDLRHAKSSPCAEFAAVTFLERTSCAAPMVVVTGTPDAEAWEAAIAAMVEMQTRYSRAEHVLAAVRARFDEAWALLREERLPRDRPLRACCDDAAGAMKNVQRIFDGMRSLFPPNTCEAGCAIDPPAASVLASFP